MSASAYIVADHHQRVLMQSTWDQRVSSREKATADSSRWNDELPCLDSEISNSGAHTVTRLPELGQ